MSAPQWLLVCFLTYCVNSICTCWFPCSVYLAATWHVWFSPRAVLPFGISLMHVSAVRHDWQSLMSTEWGRNTDDYKNIFLLWMHKNKINTCSWLFRLSLYPQLISISLTHTWSEINFQLLPLCTRFMQCYRFYCHPLMGAGRGLFLNGVLVEDYMMSGLDVTLHSRLEMRL